MYTNKIYVWAVAVLALLAVPLIAALSAEVPAVTLSDFAASTPAPSPEAHWIWTLLAGDAVYKIWLWLISFAASGLVGWLKWQGTRKEKAVFCLMEGVKEVGDAWVRAIKLAREDGKLTEEERRRANQEAIDFAIAYAERQGIDILKFFAEETLPAIIDYLVRKLKGESALSKFPLPVLPDLGPSAPSV